LLSIDDKVLDILWHYLEYVKSISKTFHKMLS
jgi:hypothetical protein